MAKDPVCGMTVHPAKAAAEREFAGSTYYFCAKGCAARFEKDPQKFLSAAVASQSSSGVVTIAGAAPITHAPSGQPHRDVSAASASTKSAESGVRYTCPMHPDIVQAGPGSCPICGMALEPMDPLAELEADPEYNSMRNRFIVGLVLSVPLLVLSMGGESLLHNISAVTTQWIELLLATPVVLWCGWRFFQRFWASLINRSPNMFTLIGLGTGAAYLYSVLAVVFPQIFPASL